MTQALIDIQIEAATAAKLNARAAARGLSVSDFLAELVADEASPDAADAAAIAELDRRWARVKVGATAANEDVAAWLDTWGKPAYRPWNAR